MFFLTHIGLFETYNWLVHVRFFIISWYFVPTTCSIKYGCILSQSWWFIIKISSPRTNPWDCWNMEHSSPRLQTAHVIQTFLLVLKQTSSTLISRLQVHWRMMLRIMERSVCADLSELNLACRCECAPRVYCVPSRYHCIAVSSVRERKKGRERAR